MLLNSLVIVADAASARLYRLAQTDSAESPLDLIEVARVAAVEPAAAEQAGPARGTSSVLGPPATAGGGAAERSGHDPNQQLAHRIARRVASFAEHHLCNPVIVTAGRELLNVLLVELEREVPSVYVRALVGESAQCSPSLLVAELVRQFGDAPAYHGAHP